MSALARLIARIGSHIPRAVIEAPGDIIRGFRSGVAWFCNATDLPAEVLSMLLVGCYVAFLLSLVPR